MKRASILLGIAAFVFVIWNKQVRPNTQLTGRAMGCDWKLVTEQSIDLEKTRRQISTTLEHWEQSLSTWRPSSDLSRFNQGHPATPDLQRVLDLSDRLHHDTRGAYDHRLLAQLTAAGFGPGGQGTDLSSIGKGFAVDRVAEALQQLGIRRFAFSLAGEVRTGEGTWPVGISSPTPGSTNLCQTLELTRQSMATSGNTRQWKHPQDGKLTSHILDPQSGKPVLRPPCSVTVIAPDAATASAWATALFVLGPEKSPLARSHGLQVIWHGTP